jgi:hypothetical protein
VFKTQAKKEMSQKLHELFSPTVELQQFSTKNINHIPSFISIIYTVFLDQTEYIYVGIGGLSGKSVHFENRYFAKFAE